LAGKQLRELGEHPETVGEFGVWNFMFKEEDQLNFTSYIFWKLILRRL